MANILKNLTIVQKICLLTFAIVCYFVFIDKGEGGVIYNTPEFINECVKTGGAKPGCL